MTDDALNELEDTLADCDRAVAADPGNAKAHSNRGRAGIDRLRAIVDSST